jgi:hypothetical protein
MFEHTGFAYPVWADECDVPVLGILDRLLQVVQVGLPFILGANTSKLPVFYVPA